MLNILFPGTSNAFAGLTNDPMHPIAAGPDHPRRNSCLAIRGDHFVIGVDLGYGAFDGLMEAGWPLPNGFLITHNHYDHLSSESVDCFARWAKLLGKRPWVLATERSWSTVSEFHKGHFEFLPVHPAETYDVIVAESSLKIHMLDSAAHWPGCVNFILEAERQRIGVFLDRKTWSGIEKKIIENLDLAVIPCNSLWPMAEKTGHVSVTENLQFLRSLRQPPRLTIALHYGTDDPIVYTQGSLAALLTALAPDLNIRIAWSGMILTTDVLPPRNPVAVLQETGNGVYVVGVEEKNKVHADELLHASVISLVKVAPRRLLVYTRAPGQTFAGCIDSFGGHCGPDEVQDIRI
jgi:L-ascorbate metabolism protein UlaG (beta-lactamase superfamily)